RTGCSGGRLGCARASEAISPTAPRSNNFDMPRIAHFINRLPSLVWNRPRGDLRPAGKILCPLVYTENPVDTIVGRPEDFHGRPVIAFCIPNFWRRVSMRYCIAPRFSSLIAVLVLGLGTSLAAAKDEATLSQSEALT